MMQTTLSVLILIVGVAFLARRADVRLVLSLMATALFTVAGKFPMLLTTMATEMTNPETVVPICAALGFAYVLRLTACDQHLVQLLLKPLRLPVLRFLLIPGGIVVGYLMNTTIVSQTAVAAVVGPILLPLLRANAISAETAGSLLLLGSSMGGELFNPGAVEMRTLEQLTQIPGAELVQRTAFINLTACAVTLLVYWRMTLTAEARHRKMAGTPEQAPNTVALDSAENFRLNPIKAMVPVVPLAFLVASPYLHLAKAIHSYIVILLAMLIGVTAAVLSSPRLAGKMSGVFFEGAGYGYTHVISLIVTAKMFTEGVKASGLLEPLVRVLSGQPILAILASIGLPYLLAVICGSGIAPTVAVLNVLVPAAGRLGLDAVPMGATTAMAAHFGRTMSPAAAVVMICAQLSGTEPLALVRRVGIPLLSGLATLFALSLWRLWFP
jgi:DcuC family C4-dicarboxylate transporter